MKNGQDSNLLGEDLIDEAISVDEDLANCARISFGDDPAALGEE